jgi:hypothetical protein
MTRSSSPSCDIVGLYVNPPDHAIVLSIDEKSQIQALDRTQPGLPMKKGRAATLTHDYKRHGTTTLFAALDVLEGKLIGQCMKRHRHQEFIRFLNVIDARVPAKKTVHAIIDNYAAHKHPKVLEWLARHPRFVFHFTSTSASWLNAKACSRCSPNGVSSGASSVPSTNLRKPSTASSTTPTQPATLYVDKRSRQDHRCRQTRAPSVRFDPLDDSERERIWSKYVRKQRRVPPEEKLKLFLHQQIPHRRRVPLTATRRRDASGFQRIRHLT